MKYTISEFAQEIRKIYPGDYDDLTDSKLIELWLKKYPADKEKIEFNTYSSGNGSGKFINLILNIGLVLFGMIIVGIGIAYFNNPKELKSRLGIESNGVERINPNQVTVDTIDHSKQNTAENSRASEPQFENRVSDQQDNEESKSNIPNTYSSEINNKVESNDIIQSLEFDPKTLKIIKIILSDNNPDSQNKNGTYCGEKLTNCKWCSRSIVNRKVFKTIQEVLNMMFFEPGVRLFMKIEILDPITKEETKSEIQNYCIIYKNGEKYICESEDVKEFCSLKCENEYKHK